MVGSTYRFCLLLSALMQVASSVRAETPPPRVSPAPQELEFSAGHVEFTGPLSDLRLSQGVQLTVNRYRVTADQLTLERSPTGLQVKGDGAVAFCPCERPPLTVSFSHATVAPPTDLMLRSATFKAYGVPVFWLPVFWVRSPNRSGLMTPRLSYRGGDGPFIGTGLHLPLSRRVEPSPEYLDLSIGGYGVKGVDAGAQLVTVNTFSSVRWDYVEHGFLELDALGHRAIGDAASVAWRVDALRGRRARTGFVGFEASTRAYDHGRVEALLADGRHLIGLGFQETELRGTAIRDVGTWGPVARVGVGTAIADYGQAESSLVMFGVANDNSSIEPLMLHRSSMALDARPGPLSMKASVHEGWLLATGTHQSNSGGILGAEGRVGLPLLRGFGNDQSPLTHWVEPQLLATAAVERSERTGNEATNAYPVSLQAGLLNILGRPRGANSTSLLLRGGGVGTRELLPALAGKWASSGEWVSLGAAAGTVEPWEDGRAWMSSIKGRLGRPDRVAVGARLDGRGVNEPLAVRWLVDDGFNPWLSRWYSQPGWTLGLEFEAGVLQQLALMGGTTMDLEQEAALSHRLGSAYRHPCGCLAVTSLAGWRVGRDGWDVTVLLDLMP